MEFGGPIPWFSVSLSIMADDLDPDAVTRLLGVEPDDAGKRGIPTAKGHLPRSGMWTICLRREQTTQRDVGLAVGMLLDRVPASAEAWRKALANANARVFVGLRLDAFNRGLALTPDLLGRLADLGLRLDFDIYADGGDTVQG